MKKKYGFIALIALILVCSLTLFACGTTAENETPAAQSDAEVEEEVVYITAYDLAVRDGFVGTEQEWLASLKGADGQDGKDGEDGVAMFSISDVYDAAVQNGYTGTFLEFVKEYIGNTATTSNVTLATNKGLLSAVSVIAQFTIQQYDRWGRVSESSANSGGAGVIYKLDKETGDAYVLTNFHVVYNANSVTENKFSDQVTLCLYGSEFAEWAISATVLGGSAYYDVAVLKVTGSEILKNSDAQACEVTTGDPIVGQTAIAIGYPQAEGISATCGIVSVDSETISLNIEGSNTYTTREFRMDTAINSGNSGGGIYNDEGKLIGLVNARHNDISTYTTSEDIDGISYGIPISIVTGVADNVIDNCNGEDKVGVYKCMLGITTTIDNTRMVYDSETGLTSIVQNVVVAEVNEDGLAYGKLEVDDVLTGVKIGDTTYTATRSYHVSEALLNARVGDTVTVYFIRANEERSADFVMTEESVTIFLTK